MALSLKKGENVSLTKTSPGLSKVTLGLGWEARTTAGEGFDLDASALLLNGGKVRTDKDLVFYGNPASDTGSVTHNGDNRTGAGDGDDETISVDLNGIPADVDKVVFAVSIYEAEKNGQTFGQVRDAFIRLVDASNGAEILRYDLSEDYSVETAVNFAELYRNGEEWKFRALGQGYSDGLGGIARDFGVNV